MQDTGQDAGQDEERAAYVEAAGRFTAELRRVRDPQRRMPGSAWSPAEAAVHVLQLLRVFQRLAAGGPSPYRRHEEFGEVSGELIAAEPERDPRQLAASLEREAAGWLAAVADRTRTASFNWHGIVDITVADATGILLGEFLLHGRDVALAEGRRWPLRPDHARTVITSILPLLPAAVDQRNAAGVRVGYRLHVRGMPPVTLRFDDGRLVVRADGEPVDCHLAGDPVAVLLVAYGRWSQWRAIASGRLVAWGRRPWLGLRFTSLLRNP